MGETSPSNGGSSAGRRARLKWLAGLLALGLAARLTLVMTMDPRTSLVGGDGVFYLSVAQNLANGYGFVFGQSAAFRTDPVITAGPLYPAFLSGFYWLLGGRTTNPIVEQPDPHLKDRTLKNWRDFCLLYQRKPGPLGRGFQNVAREYCAYRPYWLLAGRDKEAMVQVAAPIWGGEPWVMGARIGQAVIGALTAAVAYALARQLPAPPAEAGPDWGERVGLVAAGIMALDLRFVAETEAIYTETLFTFILVAGLTLYATAHRRGRTYGYAAAWLVIGLAALTRPVALALYPALLLHLWLSRRRPEAARQSLVLAAMAALVIVPWLVRNYLVFGKITLIGDSAASHFWLGAIRNGEWQGLEDFVNQQIAISGGDPNHPPYLRAALTVIAQHPLRFAQLLGLKLVRAYLQPFGTAFFPGPSLKLMLVDVFAGRLSPSALLGDPAFWPKAIDYVFHFGTIGLGLAGMWWTRKAWRETLPPILAIAALSATYALLTIIPRYLFPIMPFYTLFAAWAIVALWSRRPFTS